MKKAILFSSVIFSLPVWASEAAANVKPGPALLQTLFGLAVVVGLILSLAWVSKRLSGGRLGNQKFMKILAVQPLGTREKILLVDVAGQQMMLGVAPGRISMLHVFDEPVMPVPPEGAGNLAARSVTEFSQKLHEFLNQGNKSE
ncbi:flagellar biosynthetic protein FliO [Saccharophagus sp. K07]|uniref:flagellar biosynthetic protein FliO n=1 Tax=Saccharophagus sp. K07 TaxID=2283636 RepID=UPI001CA35C3A|nr:flagellar biosynthetic protein FliO [Saccharophagus sp. K07]